ncbi:MAG: T9SS type A sorting domain-containing protein, partial [candidate division Zixibacteria bacterium]|nr:T9SS type A sorting domain-containing protein [candidate division Zixibacteria bacterium]
RQRGTNPVAAATGRATAASPTGPGFPVVSYITSHPEYGTLLIRMSIAANPPWWSTTKTDVVANSYPAMAVDTATGSAHRGTIYVVWADKRNGDADVFLIKSSDQGALGSWTQTPIRVNQDQPIGNGKDQWLPWVSVDPSGGVNVVFYDCRNNASGIPTRAYMARSADGGQTFTDFQVSDKEFNVFGLCDYKESPTGFVIDCSKKYMGDYIGITSSADYIFPCWMEPRPFSTVENRKIYNMVVAIVPRVTQGLPGHISTSEVWSATKYITGDVVIDPGVTVTVRSGTRIVVKENRDDYHSGLDTTRAEIIVNYNGVLKIDSMGDPPVFKADSNHIGTWYGIRTEIGGKIESGRGFQVRDAYKGITLSNGSLATSLRGIRVENSSLAGIWVSSSLASLNHDTVVGITPGYGIYLDQADPEVDSCVVDSCESGIYSFESSGMLRGNHIDGRGMYGIYVSSGGSYNDTLRVVRDSVSGYFTGAHLFAGYKGHCRIDSSDFVAIRDTAYQSLRGVYASQDAGIKMRNSKIIDYGGVGFFSYKSKADLGKTKQNNSLPYEDPGNNSIYSAGTTYPCDPCRGCLCVDFGSVLHLADLYSTDTIRAENNWWGTTTPSSALFSGPIDYTPWLTSNPLPKVAPPIGQERAEARNVSLLTQNYPNPFNPSTRIGFELASTQNVQVRVFNILGQVVKVLVDQELPAGKHDVSWDGTDDHGSPVASGIYLCRLVAGGAAESKKMVLLR